MSSRSLNRITLIGNLTRDPELKYTPQGTAVCTFGVATNRNWTTATGELKEEAQFHRIVAWQKLAELCSKLLTKGKKVYLEGRVTYRTFTGRDGVQRTITEIVLDDFIIFDSLRRTDVGTHEKPLTEEISPSPSEEKKLDSKKSEKPSFAKASSYVKTSEDKSEGKGDSEEEKVEPEDIPF